MTLLLLIIGSLIFLVLLSFGVEALRQRPTAPATLYWAPEIPIQTTEIGGNAIRANSTKNRLYHFKGNLRGRKLPEIRDEFGATAMQENTAISVT